MKNYGVVELSEAKYIEMTDEIERLRAKNERLMDAFKGLWSLLLYDYDTMPDECRKESHKAAREIIDAAIDTAREEK